MSEKDYEKAVWGVDDFFLHTTLFLLLTPTTKKDDFLSLFEYGVTPETTWL